MNKLNLLLYNKNSQEELNNIWQQVPPDYYQRGVTKNPLQWIWHSTKIKTFKKLLGKKIFLNILDIGCAGGFMTNQISQYFPKSKVFGVDAYPAAIAYAKAKYPQIQFKVADAHKLPFADNSFNLVVCYETIEHVKDPKKILQEIHRVIKENGTVVLAMDSGNLCFKIIWWMWEKTFGKVWQGSHLHPFHHKELEKTLKESNFKIIRKHFSHFGMEVSFLLRK